MTASFERAFSVQRRACKEERDRTSRTVHAASSERTAVTSLDRLLRLQLVALSDISAIIALEPSSLELPAFEAPHKILRRGARSRLGPGRTMLTCCALRRGPGGENDI